MKKYLVTLILAVLVSVSLISCGDPFADYGGGQGVIIGFEYKFTSDSLRFCVSAYPCETFYIYDSPSYKQYIDNDNGMGFYVDSLSKGDTLTIYSYRYEFNYTKDKGDDWYKNYFKNNHREYFVDSVVIIGPSERQKYRIGSYSTIELEEQDFPCP